MQAYAGLIVLGAFGAVAPAQTPKIAPAAAPASASASALTVENAWVRVTPGADVAAAYMTLHNRSARPLVVIGVQSALAGHAMIHESKLEGGQSTMRAVERLVVPAGASVTLAPGGLHVMLHMLAHTPAVGEAVPLVLQLEGGATVSVSARVRPLAAD
jgi:periplasmic copper chaperone A